MSQEIGKSEKATQERVLKLFQQDLGYRFLGSWQGRSNNQPIEEDILTAWLKKRGHSEEQIKKALYKLQTEAQHPSRSLYENNRAVYGLMRYGVQVKTTAEQYTQTIPLVDWKRPDQNDFAVVEEVTLKAGHERRPDIVLYINGLAIAVLEIKNSRVSVGEGIRQSISNQKPEFNAWFYSTIQFVFAGNDTEGLRYGTIETPEKMFLTWKEDEQDNAGYKLDKYLRKICEKRRILELIHDFVLFDGGTKKLPRVHQYFGIKAAQERVYQKKGGIIWHTQGSGKSIVMVLLAKWILENNPNARVAIITDRDELDKQIEGVFKEVGERIYRASSGEDLMRQLGKAAPRLLCSLVHKFGRQGMNGSESYLQSFKGQPHPTQGEIFVFVDECHRTQSGKLHKQMKAAMPSAVFIGFTGTPLLKQDRASSLEVFGGYIHTYKFREAVEDGVVLDFMYEARDIDQQLGSVERIDAWFEAKTKGLNKWQKDALKKQWSTMQTLLSSAGRMERVVQDIVFDFGTRPRLSNQRGTAMLVCSSIYEACRYFALFQKTPFKGYCAIITSYNPQAGDVSKEDVGNNTETGKQFVYQTYTELLKNVPTQAGMSKTEVYEEQAKQRFREEPAQMKLLIVVDKLLTGFDAPSCTYLYIDKSMQDHGLFQAICRTNRLDGEDKDFGYIVDYKDLFKKVKNVVSVYTSELDHSDGGVSPEVHVNARLKAALERLAECLEALDYICEIVPLPKDELAYIHHFCGNTEIPKDLEEHAPQREALHKAVVSFVRAYANAVSYLEKKKAAFYKERLDFYVKLRETIRQASGEVLDLKAYEADMRHLIDQYIEAKEPKKLTSFDDQGFLEIIARLGTEEAIKALPPNMQRNQTVVAETIENNVRRQIVKEHLNDPAFYAKMSELLEEVIQLRRTQADAYKEYLERIEEIAKQVQAGKANNLPPQLNTAGKRALYNNLKESNAFAQVATDAAEGETIYETDADPILRVALALDQKVKEIRPDSWRGSPPKEMNIKKAIYSILQDKDEVERIFLVIKELKGEY